MLDSSGACRYCVDSYHDDPAATYRYGMKGGVATRRLVSVGNRKVGNSFRCKDRNDIGDGACSFMHFKSIRPTSKVGDAVYVCG